MDGDLGWVRVHSDADEDKSDEEFLTRNILRDMIEVMHGFPPNTGGKYPPLVAHFWELHPEWDELVNEYAEKIAREWTPPST